ncbi:MAG: carboxylating nicotinate-nucleotide diphosphorylase, partial [Clostridia bacterium]|nr:carboxylating nicotinate-nucleotide diphosphorylase [Clostridia bacterium]
GNARSVLTGERLGLNIMQHLSGIATKTRYYVDIIAGTGARIADTRKATPGMRVLEKYAVRVGGGYNHRMNLSDGVLIKDNHIVAAGGIKNAVAAAKRHAPHTLKIEVETENEDEIREALEAGADIIMLDNMTLDKMAEAVKLINRRAIVEASGNMGDKSDEELRKVALTGVDLISIGALTHSVKAFDISLKFTIKTN